MKQLKKGSEQSNDGFESSEMFWMFWAALIVSTSVEVQRGIFTVIFQHRD